MSATANLPLCRWKINIAAHWMLVEDVSSSLFLMRRKGHPKPNVMLFKIPVLAERNYLTLILVSQYPIHLHWYWPRSSTTGAEDWGKRTGQNMTIWFCVPRIKI